MPHEMSNELRLRNLRELENIRKNSKPHRIIAYCKVLLPK